MIRNHPEWLKEAPLWFQSFFYNDHTHLVAQVKRIEILQWIILTSILGGAIGIIAKVI